MKNIYLREIRHIIANHLFSNKATGYRIESESMKFKIIRDMIKHNWIEGITIDGPFLFVSPSKQLITVFGPLGIINKPSVIPSIKRSRIWNSRVQNSNFNPIEMATA